MILAILVLPLEAYSKNEFYQRRRFNIITAISFNSNSIQTKQTASTTSANTSTTFEAFELGGDYFISDRVALSGQLLLSLLSSIDAGIKGYSLGARYYFLSSGHETETKILGTTIESTPGWTPFVHGGFVGRDYQFSTTNISFQGIELGGGIDYHFKQHRFLRGSADFQSLQNTSTRKLTGFSLGLAYGFSF